MPFTPPVEEAIGQLRRGLPNVIWKVAEDASGGAVVVAESVALGGVWEQADTWVGFRIPFNYPYADMYPHFVRGDLRRRDGQPLGDAMTSSTFEGRKAVQLSRRSTQRDPAIETPLIKLHKVLTWLRVRP